MCVLVPAVVFFVGPPRPAPRGSRCATRCATLCACGTPRHAASWDSADEHTPSRRPGWGGAGWAPAPSGTLSPASRRRASPSATRSPGAARPAPPWPPSRGPASIAFLIRARALIATAARPCGRREKSPQRVRLGSMLGSPRKATHTRGPQKQRESVQEKSWSRPSAQGLAEAGRHADLSPPRENFARRASY